MNKDIDGSQCTIEWHVDDIKISHKNQQVVNKILEAMNAEYGKETPLTITHGPMHEYLGMKIDSVRLVKLSSQCLNILMGLWRKSL